MRLDDDGRFIRTKKSNQPVSKRGSDTGANGYGGGHGGARVNLETSPFELGFIKTLAACTPTDDLSRYAD